MADLNNNNIASSTKIVGGDELSFADVDSDNRLLVAAKVDAEVDVAYEYQYLLNGASKSQTVNGSGTPVLFYYAPGAGEIVFVDALSFLLEDSGTLNSNEYGNISGGLTNGVLIGFQSNGVLQVYTNLQTNLDVAMFLAGNRVLPSSGAGFLNTNDVIFGERGFNRPITLRGDDGDFFAVQIRDNLSGIDNQVAGIHFWRKL